MRSPTSSLLNDLYQLTMAYGYWKAGVSEKQTAFHLFFRKPPFGGGFTVACGLEDALRFLEEFRFDESDLDYIATLRGNDDKPLFEKPFLDYLRDLRLELDVEAMREGTTCFAHEPLLRVVGPVIHCQLVETALLNVLNFQTLIATKAARVCIAAQGEEVLEFGARRAQGNDGALSASRAAFIGGCGATSNMLAGKTFGIPVRGTHAHSWVMLFDDEMESFKTYARAMPNNCVFLVDTYDTLEGVRNAAQVGVWLRSLGHKLAGIRLDSGDLAYLSIEARRILDDAGLSQTGIIASNDLDETIITSLKQQGAQINVWGVGTQLVTGGTQAALGGVYKLAAVRDDAHSDWQPRVKLSDDLGKTSVPGVQQVRRFSQDGRYIADAIYLDGQNLDEGCLIIDPSDAIRRKNIAASTRSEDLLIPVMRGGQRIYDAPPLSQIRDYTQRNLNGFYDGIKRFVNPHRYPAGLESSLHALRAQLIEKAKTPSA